MRKIISLIGILAVATLIVIGCSGKIDDVTKPDDNKAKLSISMSLQPAIDLGYTVTKVHVVITKSSFSDSMDLTISGSSASGTFTGLEPGTYTVNVYVYQNTTLLATGTGTGTVTAGQTTTVTITVYFTGNITVIVTWADLTQGLLAYYPFNGNANDESGNGNNGTVNGAILTTDRFGNTNKAYSFDGTSNHISVSDNSLLNFGISSDFTICGWVKISNNQNYPSNWFVGFISKSADSSGYHLGTVNNKISAEIRVRNNYGTIVNVGGLTGTGSTILTDNQWHFVAVIINRSTSNAKTFVDDTLQADVTDSLMNKTVSNNEPLLLGCSHGLDRFMKGILDDVRIYNRVLSEQEIQALYHEGGW